MMNKLLAAAALLLVACADQVEPPQSQVEVLTQQHERPAPAARVAPTARVVPAEAGANICQMLPEDGPCSLACDPAALAEKYIAVNTCVMFSCTLTDGQEIHIGGCR